MENKKTTVEAVIRLINAHKVDITKGYKAWFSIAHAIYSEFREEGRKFFHEVSSISTSYDERECNRIYDKCESSGVDIRVGTFFYYCKLHGIVSRGGTMVYDPSIIAGE